MTKAMRARDGGWGGRRREEGGKMGEVKRALGEGEGERRKRTDIRKQTDGHQGPGLKDKESD